MDTSTTRPGRLAGAALLAIAAAAAACGRVADTPPASAHAASAATPAAASDLLERVAVIGASVSDGFLLSSEFGAHVTLADFVSAALSVEHAAPSEHASAALFLRPLELGRKMVDEARARDPTLVVALDFPFWFGYGAPLEPDQRLALLERGLALLERFECPLLVGDFPDVRPALEGELVFGVPAIVEQQIPDAKTLAALDRRLAEWVRDRPGRVLVPAGRFLARLRAGETVELRGNRWTPSDLDALLRRDRLHATGLGTAAVAVLCLDALCGADLGLSDSAVRWSAAEIRAAVAAAASAAPRGHGEDEER